jgi:hypothetical protein
MSPGATAAVGLMFLAWTSVLVAETEPVDNLDVAAHASVIVQPTGPRPGLDGAEYFNIEGRQNGRFASFGVLTFSLPRRESRLQGMTLTLVQCLAKFARDGKVAFYLIPATGDPARLRFDLQSGDGLGTQLADRHPIGPGTFRPVKTGHPDAFALSLDETSRAAIQERLKEGGEIRLLIVPSDDPVAATYFGAGERDPSHRPRLTLDLAAP